MELSEITSRAEWGARSPKGRKTIATPSRELWLHHSADGAEGAAGMRATQRYHMEGRGYVDVAYSFCVDRFTGEVFEGRGAGVRGGHTKSRNTRSHAICVFGNFEEINTPTAALIERLGELVALGHRLGWWPAGLSGGHRDVSSTACPGSSLYRVIPEINRVALRPPGPATPLVPITEEQQMLLAYQAAEEARLILRTGWRGPDYEGLAEAEARVDQDFRDRVYGGDPGQTEEQRRARVEEGISFLAWVSSSQSAEEWFHAQRVSS